MTRYLDWFRQARTLPGEAILTPGEPERIARARRGEHGVPLPSEAWASIVVAARSVGVKGGVPSEPTAKPIRVRPTRPSTT
jgi:hydroxycarboxylate dehydrogenase B